MIKKSFSDLTNEYIDYLRNWKDKKEKKMLELPDASVPDSSLLFDTHITSGFRWGLCIEVSLNMYLQKRIDVITDFTSQNEKTIIGDGINISYLTRFYQTLFFTTHQAHSPSSLF